MATAAAATVQRAEELLANVLRRWRNGEKSFPDLNHQSIMDMLHLKKTHRFQDNVMDIAIENKLHNEENFNLYISKVGNFGFVSAKNAMNKMRENKLIPSTGAYATMGAIIARTEGWDVATSYLHKRGMLGLKEWNVLMHDALASDGLYLYHMMKEKNVAPSLDTFHSLIQAHANKSENVAELHTFPPKGVFDEMRRVGIEPTAQTYEMLTVLRDYHDPYVAKKMHDGMKKRKLTPTIPTYVRWIKMASVDKDWDWGETLWHEVKGKIEAFDQEALANLLAAFSSKTDSTITLEIVRSAVKYKKLDGTQGYNYIISAAAQTGDVETCTSQFRLMQQEGFTPNTETFTHLMNALLQRGEFPKVIALYDQLAKSLRPTHAAYIYLTAAYAGEGREADAQRTLAQMQREGFPLRVEDINVILQHMKNSSILAGLIRMRFFPNQSEWEETTKAAVLRMYTRTKDRTSAMTMYNTMTQSERAALDVFDPLLRMLIETDKNKTEILSLYRQSKEDNHNLQNATYDALVLFFAKKGELATVQELVTELESHGHQLGDEAQKAVLKLEKTKPLLETVQEELSERS